ncbi:aminotransferase class I/II-fold pyridoxal phosphate-dependent enzyme [Geojedonia litorea]|uniref:Aminotransferase class I/II-fold pyridoxal phosphate-dependent enzyme n=1 Tax=Geojedonia litorea TaxID=1268269 RepID=A0ABV9N4T9_9FLAO
MDNIPKKLKSKLELRQQEQLFRTLSDAQNLVDFSSNDYLGFSKSESIFEKTHRFLKEHDMGLNGATGSRLLTGNHRLYNKLEAILCKHHNSESALVFNSGYDANLGFFSSVPQRGDLIFYDELIHASIRDGIRLSNAKAFKFKHNDLNHLEHLLKRVQNEETVYIVSESVFSMDGDSPDLVTLSKLCKKYNAFLIIDEAHAVGVFGDHGKGLVDQLQHPVFARLITFGKGLGCHGAAILGCRELVNYLINFARSFIYTTALPPHSIASIIMAYEELALTNNINKLHHNIQRFKSEIKTMGLEKHFIESHSEIQCCLIKGNDEVRNFSNQFQKQGFDIKPILSPTVPKGQERLRFCIHSYNSTNEIVQVLKLLATFVK